MDSSLLKLSLLHPSIRQDAIDAYNEAVRLTPKGVHPVITQTVRTFEESTKLYNQGRTTPGGIVSNAKAGQSYHNYKLALDFCLVINGRESWNVDKNWMIVVDCFKRRGFEWGGDFKRFKDYPHFQKTLGYSWQQLFAKHLNNEYIEGDTYLNI